MLVTGNGEPYVCHRQHSTLRVLSPLEQQRYGGKYMSNRSFRGQTKGISFITILGADVDGFRLSTNPLPLSMQWQCSISVTALLRSHEAWCYCSASLGNASWCLSLLRAKRVWQAGSAELEIM